MTIKEVSEKYGITGDTLRYYERIGMIPPVGRTAGGIRCYTDTDLSWIELVLCMRNAGLPLEAIVEGCTARATAPSRRGLSFYANSARRLSSRSKR